MNTFGFTVYMCWIRRKKLHFEGQIIFRCSTVICCITWFCPVGGGASCCYKFQQFCRVCLSIKNISLIYLNDICNYFFGAWNMYSIKNISQVYLNDICNYFFWPGICILSKTSLWSTLMIYAITFFGLEYVFYQKHLTGLP